MECGFNGDLFINSTLLSPHVLFHRYYYLVQILQEISMHVSITLRFLITVYNGLLGRSFREAENRKVYKHFKLFNTLLFLFLQH